MINDTNSDSIWIMINVTNNDSIWIMINGTKVILYELRSMIVILYE